MLWSIYSHSLLASIGSGQMNLDSPKAVKLRKRRKTMVQAALELVATFLLAPSKAPNPFIFKMFPAGLQVGLYLWNISVCFITIFRKFLFNLVTCAAFIFYSKVINFQSIWKDAFDTDLLKYREKVPNTLSLYPLDHFISTLWWKLWYLKDWMTIWKLNWKSHLHGFLKVDEIAWNKVDWLENRPWKQNSWVLVLVLVLPVWWVLSK